MSQNTDLAAWKSAVQQLNTQGAKTALAAYGTLNSVCTTSAEKTVLAEALTQLNQLGRAWYVIAGIQNFIMRAKLEYSLFSTAFGGMRAMCAVPARGTYYLIALDVTVDVNGGTVVSQWVTRQPVSAVNIPVLLSAKSPTLRESELSGEYFDKYSEINAITSSVRRTACSMEHAVLQRLAVKLRQMRE